MKLRVTGLLLGILVFALVIVPAFAAAADQAQNGADAELEVSEEVDQADQTEEAVPAETAVSTSPFYYGDVQLSGLVYRNINGTNYVTVESFVTAMCPECMVEEEAGTVIATAVASEVVPGETGTATANVEEETLNFSAKSGSCYVTANDRYLYVESLVQMVEGRVAVPIRTMAAVFNLNVSYDSATRHILLTRQEGSGSFLLSGADYYDEETLYWLSRIIYSESGNQSMSGKIAVGNVVMNRLKSPLFPNTIKGVLFQKNQFSPAMSGSIYRMPDESSTVAAKLVMDGAVVLKDALFFNRAGMNTFAARNRTYVATIGAHAFYN